MFTGQTENLTLFQGTINLTDLQIEINVTIEKVSIVVYLMLASSSIGLLCSFQWICVAAGVTRLDFIERSRRQILLQI